MQALITLSALAALAALAACHVLAVSGLAAWKALRDSDMFHVVQTCRDGMFFEFVDERPAVGKNPLLRAVQNSTEAASSSSFNRIVTLRELSV